ncbi:MAG TPA: hypothetical protein VFI84_01175 [Candidatus Saccharimonadales bacterium]|nr:hypothetical protein [Candidatus Saccharimonadales bacterium]
MRLADIQKRQFLTAIYDYYEVYGRHSLPWRQPEPNGTFSPFKVLVSEIMLQQTQVARVIPKYAEFLGQYPSIEALAVAELSDVLRVWSGLGYNRRAKYLHQTSKALHQMEDMPKDIGELVKLPGVGKNTAGAILAYSYNQPALFIETNIRTVYIHHFFRGQSAVSDNDVLALVGQTLDTANSREFYWALMDYGSFLKQTHGNLNKLSKSYTQQTRFVGSLRQVRGEVLRQLAAGPLATPKLKDTITDSRLPQVLATLLQEGLISKEGGTYRL